MQHDVHITDHDMGSLSGWRAQGDPAVNVDYRVSDGVTPQPSLAPPQPPLHPPTNSPGLGSASKSTSDLGAGGCTGCFIFPVRFCWRSMDLFCLSVSLCYD